MTKKTTVTQEIAHLREIFNEKFSSINEKLERIEKQTIKTNGRVDKLEDTQIVQWKVINRSTGAFKAITWILSFIGLTGIFLVVEVILK